MNGQDVKWILTHGGTFTSNTETCLSFTVIFLLVGGSLLVSHTGKVLDLSKGMELFVQLSYTSFLRNLQKKREQGSFLRKCLWYKGNAELYTRRTITFWNSYFPCFFEKNLHMHRRKNYTQLPARKHVDFFSVICHVNKPFLSFCEEWPLVVLCTYCKKYYIYLAALNFNKA